MQVIAGLILLLGTAVAGRTAVWPKGKPEPCLVEAPDAKSCTALDRYLFSMAGDAPRFTSGGSPGSLYSPGGRMTDLGRDFQSPFRG